MNICNEVELAIKDQISEDLTTRNRASQFFEMVEASSFDRVVVNFDQVRSISRSFADEYVRRKMMSRVTVIEKNVPMNVKKMFDIVSSPVEKRQIIDLEKLRIGLL